MERFTSEFESIDMTKQQLPVFTDTRDFPPTIISSTGGDLTIIHDNNSFVVGNYLLSNTERIKNIPYSFLL